MDCYCTIVFNCMLGYLICNTKTIIYKIPSQKVCMLLSFNNKSFTLITSLSLWRICKHMFVCFEVFSSHSKICTHMETSPWPLKGYAFWPLLGTHGHWAVMVLYGAIPTVTWDFRWSSLRTRDSHTYCRAFGSGAVTTYFYELSLSRLGFEHPTSSFRGEL